MKEALKMSKQRIGEHEVDVKKATPKMGNRGGGFGSPGGDFYGGYMDYYGGHTYQDYYGWGGYSAEAGQEGAGGKSHKQKGTNRSNPY